ncbi:MAG: hypothetical protein LUI39_06830 [Lachnospiraceae bacterium]|nr:hypothetical protein [Lachnospiraceae bacterium]
MAKCFLTYEQQIDKLINEKGLLIADREYAENVLKRTSYYSLISGYKDLFTTMEFHSQSGFLYFT